MPLYEYKCTNPDCEYELEIQQSLNDKPLTECPECKEKFERLISKTSFVLKGNGWFNSGGY